MISIIIFDIDDTLIETFNYSFNIFQKIAGKNLDKNIFLKNYKQKNGFEKNLQYFFPDNEIDKIKIKYEEMKKLMSRKILIDLNLFYKLKNKGYKFGVLTNGPKDKTINKLNQIGFKENDFEFILHGGNLKYQKPDYRVFNYILKNYSQNKIMYIGDSLEDLKAAQDSNIKFNGVLTGISTKEDFEHYGLSKRNIFSDVNEILKCLLKK